MDTDRQLLLGLLALQNGLISQAQLLSAFQTWTLDRSKGLPDHLVALGHLSPARRPVLEAMAALHLEAHGGDVERSLAAVPASRAAQAKLAALGEPQLEATLARIGRAQAARDQATEPDDGDPDQTAGYSIGAVTSDGQRFRLLRPHARGGLGAVFVAMDSELKREVALKQILEQHADDMSSRQRFVAEAEITGGLEHPGVVPVYGLGAYPDGRPYYAMRFIRGESLKEAIEAFHSGGAAGDRPLVLRKLLRRFLDVCNAVDYAHSRGVIHRDLKPANVILGRHGETLVVDWGLAKAVGRADPTVGEQTITPSSGGSSETQPGSALGTPAYMSPEQARGELDALGPRSDVYSLGATLYCLLTGKPPFEADDVGAILRAAEAGRFAPPRQHDASIDRPLEAICLKAMATEAADRYPTPRVLADDLERWMADEPVSADREPLSRRLRRWSRRNRTAVTAAAVALLAALAGLGAVTAVQARANGELRTLTTRLERLNGDLTDEKARVQQRFDLAMDAIRTFHTGASEDFLLKEEQFKALRDKLLRSAADFYGRLGGLLRQRSDRDSRQALAQAEFELAELTAKVGDAKRALEHHREVLTLREALAAEPGADAESQAEVGRSLTALGQRQEAIGKTAEAIASYRAAQERFASLAEHRADLAAAEHALGSLLQWAGNQAEGLFWLSKSRDVRAELTAESDSSTSARWSDLATSHQSIANLLWRTGRTAEALESDREALAIWQRLVTRDIEEAAFRYNLASCQSEIGLLLLLSEHPDAAIESLSDAISNFLLVVRTNPSVSAFQSGLGFAYVRIAQAYSSDGRLREALEPEHLAVEKFRKLADANPAVFDHKYYLALACNTLSETQAKLGQLSEAMETARQSTSVARDLVASNPERPRSHEVLAMALMAVGRIEQERKNWIDAAAAFREGISAYEEIPPSARYLETHYNLACGRSMLAYVLSRSDPTGTPEVQAVSDRAMASLRTAVSLGFQSTSSLRTDGDLTFIRPRPDFQLMLLDLDFPPEPFSP